jgi:hypothetical protein
VRAETILSAYVESAIVVREAYTDMLNARYGNDNHVWERKTAAWQRRTKQRAYFLERLQRIVREYDGMKQREKRALMAGLYARRETLA